MFAFISLIFLVAQSAEADYSQPFFLVRDGKSKCFIENAPKFLPITVSYATFDNKDVACSLKIIDSQNNIVLNKVLPTDATVKRETHLTKEAGQYQICIDCPSQKWFNNEMTKWYLSIDLGDAEVMYDNAAKGYKLLTHERMMRTLTQKVNYMVKEQLYSKEIHEKMNHYTQKLTKRLGFLSLLQLIVLIVGSVIVVKNMRTYFQKENFVN